MSGRQKRFRLRRLAVTPLPPSPVGAGRRETKGGAALQMTPGQAVRTTWDVFGFEHDCWGDVRVARAGNPARFDPEPRAHRPGDNNRGGTW